jgi:creatine kinase
MFSSSTGVFFHLSLSLGVEQLDSKVGCHFCDPGAHDLFAPLLDSVIKMYHMVPDGQEIRHPPCDFGDLNNLPFGDLDPEGKYVISTRARVGRSVAGFAYAPIISYEVGTNNYIRNYEADW